MPRRRPFSYVAVTLATVGAVGFLAAFGPNVADAAASAAQVIADLEFEAGLGDDANSSSTREHPQWQARTFRASAPVSAAGPTSRGATTSIRRI